MCLCACVYSSCHAWCRFLLAVKRLMVCDELEKSNCGSLLFYCQINPPVFESLPPNYGVLVSHHQHLHEQGPSTLQPGNGHSVIVKPGMCLHNLLTFSLYGLSVEYHVLFFFLDCSRQVLQLIGHGNCIAIAYNHCICVLGYVQ